MAVRDGVQQANARCSLTPRSCLPPTGERRTRVPARPSDAPAMPDCSGKGIKRLLSMDPPVVNFGAFAPLEVRTKILRITNTSTTPVRFCILRPASCAFRISFEKKSCLAPGMTQTVTIYFVPATWKLHKSSLKVIGVPVKTQAPRGASDISTAEPSVLHLVPLSSFPELCDLGLPRFLNFGSVSLGAKKRKTLELSNPHPVSFQFAVRVVVENAAFSVEPRSGVVEARSTQVLTISYTPQVRATAFFAVEVQVADFASKPIYVESMGTCYTAGTNHADQVASVGDTLGQAANDAATACWSHPVQQRELCSLLESCTETGRRRLQPKEACPPGLLGSNSCLNAGCAFSRNGGKDKRDEHLAQGKSLLQRSSSSNSVGNIFVGRDEAAASVGGSGAAVGLDDSARISHFNRRWKATTRSMCLKTYRTIVLGEAPTTELKRQRLISKRRYDALDLLRRHSQRDLFQENTELSAEVVVVPSTWLQHRAFGSTGYPDVLISNTFIMRKESVEKFARVVSALIRRIRALRRLYTLRKVLKLRPNLAVSDADKASTISGPSGKCTTYETFPKKAEAVKKIRISFVPPQRTTYQELFQMSSTKSSIPPSFLVRSKIEIADLFISFDNYESMNPLPPLDYEIMRLPDMEISSPAWHLEPTERRLLQALLRPTGSPTRKPTTAPLCDEIKFPPVVLDRPLVSAMHFVAPPTTEFRPFIPLPKTVETDLGYCFKRVQPEKSFKRGPRLSLPCFGDTSMNTIQRSPSTQTLESLLLAEVKGTHAVYCQQFTFASSPYPGKAGGRVGSGPNSIWKGFDCQMSDTDSDSRDDSIEIPVPPLEKYAQAESGDDRYFHESTEAVTHGELHDSKHDDFVRASATLSDSWGRRTVERLTRLAKMNLTLPAELRMDI